MGSEGRPARKRAGGAREELRLRRQEAILDVALEVVTTQGHDALTMQRLADELECGIASVYRLFPSKDALVAELLRHALDVLHASSRLGLEQVAAEAEARALPPGDAALAGAVATAWFWVVAEDGFPSQVDLVRRLFVDRRIVVPDEQAAGVLPGALLMLQEGARAVDEAVALGALAPGDGVERTVVLVASITGVLQTAKFGRWDQARFDGRRLARVAVRDSFTAWGADPAALDAAVSLVVELGAEGRIAPPVEDAVPLRPRISGDEPSDPVGTTPG